MAHQKICSKSYKVNQRRDTLNRLMCSHNTLWDHENIEFTHDRLGAIYVSSTRFQ